MSTTCLINSYNYVRFVGQAIDSALGQTVPFDEIIVVDDGSSDGSAELLEGRYGRHPVVQIVAKKNHGQLSCFNEGFVRATGDLVFFLDADDIYEPHYVERTLDVYRRDRSFDFVFCGHRLFGDRESLQLESSEDRDLGYSVVLTAFLRNWIGAPTSCLSMRRDLLQKILPLPFVDEWRIRADDCLVFGASLAGARKYYLAQPLVRYRVHGSNRFFGRSSDKFAEYRRRLAINTLFEHFGRKFGYDMPRLADAHDLEFGTIARPTFRQLKQYARIGMASQAPLVRRLRKIVEMTAHFLRPAARALHVFPPSDLAADAARGAMERPRKAA